MDKFNNRNKLNINKPKSSRISYNNPSNKNISRFDARLKLLGKKDILRNEYDLASKEYKHQNQRDNRNQFNKKTSLNNDSSNGPIVIVTGLGNVRKDGDRLQIVKKSLTDHLVIADGPNTIVTLKNNQTKLDESRRYTEKIYNDKTYSDRMSGSDLKQIQIRVDNEYSSKSSDLANKSIKKSFMNTNYMSNNQDIDMECCESVQSNYISKSEKTFFSKNNGFKLLISNLHPRVTEDDVLVKFYCFFCY